MALWTDPLRITGSEGLGFPQQWTVFYWAYWIAWFVATPFFIAKISRGRTIRQMIIGSFFSGLAGTWTSFIIFGNFGLFAEVSGQVSASALLAEGVPASQVILKFFKILPFHKAAMILLIFSMIAFYASTFDAITLVVSGFCIKNQSFENGYYSIRLRIFWVLIFIIFPIALIWHESTLASLQTISIIAAFPLAVIMILIVVSFIKELKKHHG